MGSASQIKQPQAWGQGRTRQWYESEGFLTTGYFGTRFTETQSVPLIVIDFDTGLEYLTEPPICKYSVNSYDSYDGQHRENTYNYVDLVLRQCGDGLEVWGALEHAHSRYGSGQWEPESWTRKGEVALIARVLAGAVQREPSEMAKVAQIFKQFDATGDGLIDKNELKSALQALALTKLVASLEQLWPKWDYNGDGFLSYDEFIPWLFSSGNNSHIWRTGDQCMPREGSEETEKAREYEDTMWYVVKKSINEISCVSWGPRGCFDTEIKAADLKLVKDGPVKGSRISVV